MILKYHNQFQIRFTAVNFITDWQKLKLGVVPVCDGNDIKINDDKTGQYLNVTMTKPQLKAFIDNIIVLAKGTFDAKSVLKKSDESII